MVKLKTKYFGLYIGQKRMYRKPGQTHPHLIKDLDKIDMINAHLGLRKLSDLTETEIKHLMHLRMSRMLVEYPDVVKMEIANTASTKDTEIQIKVIVTMIQDELSPIGMDYDLDDKGFLLFPEEMDYFREIGVLTPYGQQGVQDIIDKGIAKYVGI